jgi:hypothetical protein
MQVPIVVSALNFNKERKYFMKTKTAWMSVMFGITVEVPENWPDENIYEKVLQCIYLVKEKDGLKIVDQTMIDLEINEDWA